MRRRRKVWGGDEEPAAPLKSLLGEGKREEGGGERNRTERDGGERDKLNMNPTVRSLITSLIRSLITSLIRSLRADERRQNDFK